MPRKTNVHNRNQSRTPLLTIRLLAIASASLVVGLVVGLLGYFSADSIAVASMVGLGAFGLSTERLHRWTED